MIDEAIAATLAGVERREMGGDVPERLSESPSKAHHATRDAIREANGIEPLVHEVVNLVI